VAFRDSLGPLRSRGFRYFVTGRAVSLLGTSMAAVALAFAVLDLTGSASDLGLVLAANEIPLILFLLVGGVIADRLPRHLVLVASNAVAGACQGLVAVLLFTGNATVWTLVAIEAVQGTATAFTFPAMQGVVPQVVPRGQLQEANALLGLTRNVLRIGGPAVGGLIVATAGSAWAIAADALSFVIAAAFFARLALPSTQRLKAPNMLTELREGWDEFTSRTWVWVIVVAFGVLNAVHVGALFVLGPAIADETIGRAYWGVVLGAIGLGAVVGTVLLLRVKLRHPLRAGMLGCLALPPLLLVLGMAPSTVVLVLLAVAVGVGSEVFSIGWETALQQHIPGDRLSRVASYDAVGSFVMSPVGMIAAGPLAAAFGVREVIVTGAVAYAAIALATLVVPSVRNLSTAEPRAEPATGQ